MMGEETSKNFFLSELLQYYQEQGKNISPNIANILIKPTIELNPEEQKVYSNMVAPSKDAIKKALSDRLRASGSSLNVWKQNLSLFSQSIIGMIAERVIADVEPVQNQVGTPDQVAVQHDAGPTQPIAGGIEASLDSPPTTPMETAGSIAAKKKYLWPLIIAISTFLLFAITIIIAVLSSGNGSSPGASTGTSKSQASEWRVTATLTAPPGYTRSTGYFKVTSNKWRMRWGAAGGESGFNVQVVKITGQDYKQILFKIISFGKDGHSGVFDMEGAGDYRVMIDTGTTIEITIEEYSTQ